MATYDGTICVKTDRVTGLTQRLLGILKKQINFKNFQDPEDNEGLQKAIAISTLKICYPLETQIALKHFEIGDSVGFGSYGRIWMADGPIEFGKVAIKQLPPTLSNLPEIWKERDCLINLKHKRIVNMLAAFFERDVFLVLELCHGSVRNVMKRLGPRHVTKFSIQLLQAIEWCHKNDIIHCDIKSDNCLVNTSSNLVLSDFGSAMHLNGKTEVLAKGSHGSPGYTDLKANANLLFSKGTDIFAAACVMYEMDVRDYFLMYPNQFEHTREMYVDAITNGRIVDLTTVMASNDGGNYTRERLSERCVNSKFGVLLENMIADDGSRFTAADAIASATVQQNMKLNRLSLGQVDNATSEDVVTTEFTVDRQYQFDFIGSENTDVALEVSMAPFYYLDETLFMMESSYASSDKSDDSLNSDSESEFEQTDECTTPMLEED